MNNQDDRCPGSYRLVVVNAWARKRGTIRCPVCGRELKPVHGNQVPRHTRGDNDAKADRS